MKTSKLYKPLKNERKKQLLNILSALVNLDAQIGALTHNFVKYDVLVFRAFNKVIADLIEGELNDKK